MSRRRVMRLERRRRLLMERRRALNDELRRITEELDPLLDKEARANRPRPVVVRTGGN